MGTDEFEDKTLTNIFKCYSILYDIEHGTSDVGSFIDTFNTIRVPHYLYLFSDENKVLNQTFKVVIEKGEEPVNIDINGETLLFRAISKCKRDKSDYDVSVNGNINGDDIVQNLNTCIYHMIEKCPELIKAANKKGYSPFYLAIVKEHTHFIRKMIAMLDIENIKIPEITGSSFGRTVMLARFPLGVAALTLNKKVFRCVLKGFSSCFENVIQNGKNDTIVHCLIKYIHYHSEKVDKAKDMLDCILDETTWEKVSLTLNPERIVKQLVTLKSDEHLTPLQLAAKRQQFELFDILIHSKNYYTSCNDDGLSMNKEYDITDLETVPTHTGQEQTSSDERFVKEHHESVLEFICQQNMSAAFSFAQCTPVNEVIKTKWQKCRPIFYTWSILHLLIMSLLTWSGIHRSRIMFDYVSSNSEYVRNDLSPILDDSLSLGLTIVGFVYALLVVLCLMFRYLVIWCCFRRFQARIKANFLENMARIISNLPYSNKIFEMYFLLFGLLLILDLSLSFIVPEYDILCFVFALVIGWYCVIFFLQVFERFSFFTVLIQRVISDMINFAFVMGFLLIGFTAAMSMVMQGANDVEDDFNGFDTALFKMFTVMLGIGEISDLFKARHNYTAIIVFVIFVLLTTILLLNALIALMSNSCTELMNNKYGMKKTNELHATLQKLSVIIFLESLLPQWVTSKLQAGYTKVKYPGRRFIGITIELHEDDIGDDGEDEITHLNIFKSILTNKHLIKNRKTKTVKKRENGNSTIEATIPWRSSTVKPASSWRSFTVKPASLRRSITIEATPWTKTANL